jgi:hypothetical protein
MDDIRALHCILGCTLAFHQSMQRMRPMLYAMLWQHLAWEAWGRSTLFAYFGAHLVELLQLVTQLAGGRQAAMGVTVNKPSTQAARSLLSGLCWQVGSGSVVSSVLHTCGCSCGSCSCHAAGLLGTHSAQPEHAVEDHTDSTE